MAVGSSKCDVDDVFAASFINRCGVRTARPYRVRQKGPRRKKSAAKKSVPVTDAAPPAAPSQPPALKRRAAGETLAEIAKSLRRGSQYLRPLSTQSEYAAARAIIAPPTAVKTAASCIGPSVFQVPQIGTMLK